MKPSRLLVAALLGIGLSANAGVYSMTGVPSAVPDANLTGWSSTFNVTGEQTSITDVSIKLDITGGYNGDLYAYLSYGGKLVPLLNRVGVGTGTGDSAFGYSTKGMQVTLTDTAESNIHDVATPAAPAPGNTFATYKPDGRKISPILPAASFEVDPTTLKTFAEFGGLNPNGLWTLFIADVSGGAISTLNSAELSITAVPEPANVAMAIFGGLFGVGLLWKRFKARNA